MVVLSNQETQESLTDPKTILVDIYCRRAVQDGNTLAAQETACRQFAKDAGLKVGMVHAEIAFGRNLEREQLTLLRKRYLAGEIQGVIVYTPEQLSRSQVHSAILREEMENHDIALYYAEETLEDALTGKFLQMVLEFLAGVEREKLKDRIRIMARLSHAKASNEHE